MIDLTQTNFIKINLEKPQCCLHPSSIDMSRPRIVVFGGENTNVCTMAHNYAISIATTLWLNGITGGLDIYSAYYKLRDRDSYMDRLKLFMDIRGQENVWKHLESPREMSADLANYMTRAGDLPPLYTDDAFEFVFKPQLMGEYGSILPLKKAAANLRNTIIYTHCHGAYVLRMCERQISAEYTDVYYSKSKMADLQKNLLAINYAPFMPLEDQAFNSISFCSASDYKIRFYNQLDYHMKKTPEKFQPAFFDGKFGNIMIANNLKKDPFTEHSDLGLSGADAVQDRLTENGKILFASERNALLAGTRAMLAGKSMPKTADLISTDFVSYKNLKRQADRIRHELGLQER